MNQPNSTKEVRQRARVTVTEASVMADVSPTTWRIFEANREAVSEPIRARCDAAVARIGDIAKAREAA
jgi:hypothetical protein